MQNENGTAVTISGQEFKTGTRVTIADVNYKVYNTMPGLQLIGFAKVNKNGELSTVKESMSLSFADVEKFMKLETVKMVYDELTPDQIKAGTKAAKQDMKEAKKNGMIFIVETKMGPVVLRFEDGLYKLIKDGMTVFQAYDHTTQIFINNMVRRIYQYE